jgi:hypothetical protein
MALISKTFAELLGMHSEQHALSNLLMIGEYDPDHGVFVRVDGMVMVCLEVTPGPCQTTDNEDLEDASTGIGQSLQSLPPGSLVSATVFPSKRIDDPIERFRAYGRRSGDVDGGMPFLKAMEESIIAQFQNATTKPLLSGGDYQLKVRINRVIMTIGLPWTKPIGPQRNLMDALRSFSGRGADGLTSAEREFRGYFHQLAQKCTDIANRIARSLDRVGCRVRPLDGAGYTANLRELLYPNTGHTYQVRTDLARPIYEQVPVLPVISDPAHGQVLADNAIFRVATMRNPPNPSHPGLLSLPHRRLGGATVLDFLDDGFLTMTAQVVDRDTQRWDLNQRRRRIEGGFAMPGIRDIALNETQMAETWNERGNIFLRTEVVAVVRGADVEAADRGVRRLRDRLTEAGIDMRLETHHAPAMMMRALPGNGFPPVNKAKRDRLLIDKHFADCLPIYYHSRGTQEAMCLFLNRAGEPFTYSPFGGSSAHSLWAGRSGSGKSFGINYVSMCGLRDPRSQCFIIDKDRSFTRMVAMAGPQGRFHNLGGRCCINPAAGNPEQAAPFLVKFLSHLACPSPKDSIDGEQMGVLDAVIRQVYVEMQETVPFEDLDSLVAAYPDRWIVRAAKRLTAAYIGTTTAAQIEALKSGGDEKSWRLLYRYFLDGEITDQGQRSFTRGVNSVSEPRAAFLLNQRFLLEEYEGHVVALCESPSEVDLLSQNGFIARHDHDVTFVELSAADDCAALESVGVHFVIPPEAQANIRSLAEAELAADPAYAGSTPESRAALVDQAVRDARGSAAFRGMVGTATLQREVFLRIIGARLEAMAENGNDLARDLSVRLSPYYGTGLRSAYFDGPTSFDLAEARLYVFEQGGLAEQSQHLLSSVIGALTNALTLHCRDRRYRNRRKMLYIDEGWTLLGSAMVSYALEMLWRTSRKLGVACNFCSQNISPEFDAGAGALLKSLSPNRLWLRQDRTIAAATTTSLGYSSMQAELLQSVTSEPGSFSEIFIEATEQKPEIRGEAVLFIPTDLFYWIATSNGDDVGYLERVRLQLVAKGMSDDEALVEALKACAKQYPHGWRP